jgi:adenosine deaminase CECR1
VAFILVPLLYFSGQHKRLGLDIPFIFHAGETLGDDTAADGNPYNAILLGTKRIGRG